jgi:hypothetical protein
MTMSDVRDGVALIASPPFADVLAACALLALAAIGVLFPDWFIDPERLARERADAERVSQEVAEARARAGLDDPS